MHGPVSPAGEMPELALRALAAWRELRAAAGGLPRLGDLAPAEIPRTLLPWLMTIRRPPDGRLVYGVVGEQMVTGHAENPRGKPFLYDAPPDVTATWTGIVNRSLDTGAPFWVASPGVRAHQWAFFGRLGLPTVAPDADALVVLFFRLKTGPDREHVDWLEAGA
jgi:hypothetical protein